MHKRIKNYLNEPSTLFLSYTEGKIYFILLIPTLAFSLNILQPMGLVNWHEFHKDLILNCYSLNLVGTYAVLYFVYSRLRPAYFRRESWTKGKQLHLLSIYIPLAAVSSWVFVAIHTQEVEFSLNSFLNIQIYNCIASLFIIPCFSYFISHKLKPAQPIPVEPIPVESIPEAPPVVSPVKTDRVQIKNVSLNANKILYAECSHNKLLIYRLLNGKVEMLTKYISMTEFKDLVAEHTHLKRCHISYMVNINRVESWSGSSEKMTLYLKDCTLNVPVSDPYTSFFKELMEKMEIPKRSE